MSARAPWPLALFLAATSLAPGTVAHAAWPHDPFSGNVAVCTATGEQLYSTAVPDGAGGIILVWDDPRSGDYDIYAQRIDADGNALWTANGVLVCGVTGIQTLPVAVADGAGGVIIGWTDYRNASGPDIYTQRVNSNGTLRWTSTGVAVCTASGQQSQVALAREGAGGALFTWRDNRGADADIYGQRVSSIGSVQWVANGAVVCNATGIQSSPRVVVLGSSYLFVWGDQRFGASTEDIYGQRLSSTGAVQWTANGLQLYSDTGKQTEPRAVSDGFGGALVSWLDHDSGLPLVRAQRFSTNGDEMWGASGVLVAPITGEQSSPDIAADGAGGALVAWVDGRVSGEADAYAQRVSAGGASLWGTTGVALAGGTGTQQGVSICSDSTGGAVVAWRDDRGGSGDIYAQRVNATGTTQWGSSGLIVCGAGGLQTDPTAVPDARGGVIVAWPDERSGVYDQYCQRVERNGQLGDPAPHITSVKDVPADQGGQVKLSWSASYLDEDPAYGILDYRIWRSVPQAALAAALAARRGTTTDSDVAAETGMLLVSANAATDYAWELVTTQSAAAFPSYSLVVATVQDSTPGYAPRTAFLVEARQGTSVSSKRWSSAPDSGYSVDNLAPATPAPFTAQYSSGTSLLHWQPNHEGDLAGYRLYRGTSASFAPSPATLVSAQPDTGYADAAGAPYFYKLTAVDAHGNESPVALVQPAGTLGVEGAPLALSFAAPWPQPARGGASFRFALPARGEATLELFDAAGRRVTVLADGPHEAGEHTLRWDGRDAGGVRVAPGLYLVRLTAGGRTLTRRVVTTE